MKRTTKAILMYVLLCLLAGIATVAYFIYS